MSRRNGLLVFFTVIFLAVTSLFVFRDALLNYFLEREKSMLLKRFSMKLNIGDSGFEGVRNIYIEHLSLIPEKQDTLVYFSRAEVRLNLSMLLRLRIGFTEVRVDTMQVNVMKYKDGTDNYSILFKGRNKDTIVVARGPSQFNDRIASILKKSGNVFNDHVVIHGFRLKYNDGVHSELLSIPELYYNNDTLKASLVTSSSDGVGSYMINGNADAENDSYDIFIESIGKEKSSLPFFDLYDRFRIGFDKMHVSLKTDRGAEVIPMNVNLVFSGLRLNHWRISPVDVTFKTLQMDFRILIDDYRVTFDKGTLVRFAELPINIEGFYERYPAVRIGAKISFTSTANDFFTSLPKGMFNTLQGLKANGNLNYNLNFDIDKHNPDAVVFESSLKKERFRIIEFGQEYFPLINGDFQFTAMNKDQPVRSIFVGSANPMFTPIGTVSAFLKNAVLTSEDPGFMTHNGFVESAFRESIATNIKEGRFARGGSTISMQLVKNLFLSHNKTISRKLEEALIVWLIEQNKLVTKERMFEVYLNIIEWGPGIYGIGEASQFYFNKHPHDLSLPESVFLASIIPHPKYFKYMFDSTGTLKPNQRGFYTLISNRLLSRNLISKEDYDKADTLMKISGEAFKYLRPLEALPHDSLDLEDP